MDFVYASGRLSVKLAELKKIETQINGLAGKSREEILTFLNHLQLAGNSEMNDFLQIMQGSEKILADELKSLTNESQYYLLDAVFADDLITFLNLKLNSVHYQNKFKPFDVIHLSLQKLLEGETNGNYEFYQKLITRVQADIKVKGRAQEAFLTKLLYQHLSERLEGHPYIDAKETAINIRSLYRAKVINLNPDEFKEELLGDTNKIEKFANLFRLDDRQIVSMLKEKFDQYAADTYDKIASNPAKIDLFVDYYLEAKMGNLIFSSNYVDLLLLYGFQKKRVFKLIKSIYSQGEKQ